MNINPAVACCFSGYRPEKFPFPLEEGHPSFEALQSALSLSLRSLVERGYTTFLTGMCRGFDLLAAESLLSLPLPPARGAALIAVLPFANQTAGWPAEWARRYGAVLARCGGVVNVCGRAGYARGLYAARNRYLVEHSAALLCYWTGRPGGTQYTVRCAARRGLTIQNLAGGDAPCA